MPLFDGDGNLLTGGGDPLSIAEFGSGDPLWVVLAQMAIDALLQWAASFPLSFCGPPVYFGAFAGPVAYQRYCFNGLTVTHQYSNDGGEWHDSFSVGFGFSDLSNVRNLAERLVELSTGFEHSWQELGFFPTVAGVSYPTEESQMTAIQVGNVKKLVVSMSQSGEPFQASFHFRKANDATGANGEADLVSDFRAQAEPGLLACMSADVTIDNYRVEDRISPGTTNGHLRTYIGAELTANVGTAAAANTSNILQAAGCISWYTNFAGRGERGRTFIPGLPVPLFADNGRLTDAAVAAYGAFIDALLARYDADTDGAADWQLVLWRSHESGAGALENNPPAGQPGHVAPATAPPFNPLAGAHGITLGKAQRVVRSLRRRGVGVRIGRH